jgi:hypothetical protein
VTAATTTLNSRPHDSHPGNSGNSSNSSDLGVYSSGHDGSDTNSSPTNSRRHTTQHRLSWRNSGCFGSRKYTARLPAGCTVSHHPTRGLFFRFLLGCALGHHVGKH